MAILTESLNVIERSSLGLIRILYLHSFVLFFSCLTFFSFSTLFVRFLFVSFFLFCFSENMRGDADTESIRVFYSEKVGMKWERTSNEHLLNGDDDNKYSLTYFNVVSCRDNQQCDY